VLGAYLSWRWIERQVGDLRRALDTRRRLDLLLLGEDDTVLVGPAPWLGHRLAGDADLTGAGAYVVGRRAEHAGRDGGLAWKVVVRQGAEAALEPARATRRAVFLVVLAAGLLAAAAGVLVTRLLTRRLAALAHEAHAVRGGARRTLTVPAGTDEVSRIGATLAEVVDHLQQEKLALQRLNTELDARVVERTARIERLSDEARHAAVTRERLRLARDLHDTLAHSLMALLTQIRLVRKLRHRFEPAELDAELGRAEDTAVSGLTEARAAITQMRHNGVRDVGLGAALHELCARVAERTALVASVQADPAAAALADERAETVFQIVEEALHNVEHHAQASSVRVALRCAAPAEAGAAMRVRVEITDDGAGFEPASPQPGHYGLIGMREQALLIGARLDVHSRAGEGARIVLEFDA
jgi:signal transduction histidine kinase